MVRNLSAFTTLFALGKSWDNVRTTTAPYTESRLAHFYGPNHDNKDFYTEIDTLLSQDSSILAVLGGDWNASYSTRATADNINIRNMRNPPSLARSAWIQQICAKRKLSDPFRALHPSLKEYTYCAAYIGIGGMRIENEPRH